MVDVSNLEKSSDVLTDIMSSTSYIEYLIVGQGERRGAQRSVTTDSEAVFRTFWAFWR